jgi:BirA family biotin operon repressor/biotin-[acetyl-CoA-carboxylase] ligase
VPDPVEPWRVERLAETDSTNRVVLERARAGEAEGLVVVADHQTAGRGRLGRTWQAPPGASLLVTLLLRPTLAVADVHLVTIAAALAAADAADAVAGVRPSLKWPNDLLFGSRKVAGLLAESMVTGGRVDAVALGMGLNVQWPADLPADLAEIATALNHEAGHDVDRDTVLDAWLDGFGARYAVLDPAALVEEYRGACVTIGREVRVELADETFTGRATDVTAEGHLVVDGRIVTAGDVIHLRGV